MSLTFEEAQDEIMLALKDAWDATGHPMFYENVRNEDKPSGSPWALNRIRHAANAQRSLGGKGHRIFQRTGVLIVQINTRAGKGLSESYALAKVIIDALEGETTPNGVRFRSTAINENGVEGSFFSMNVFVNFEYDEIK